GAELGAEVFGRHSALYYLPGGRRLRHPASPPSPSSPPTSGTIGTAGLEPPDSWGARLPATVWSLPKRTEPGVPRAAATSSPRRAAPAVCPKFARQTP